MIQAKFSLTDAHIQFLGQHKQYGFKDKSDFVRTALDRLRSDLAQQRLSESAELYADIYAVDGKTREWTDDASSDWPT